MTKQKYTDKREDNEIEGILMKTKLRKDTERLQIIDHRSGTLQLKEQKGHLWITVCRVFIFFICQFEGDN